MLTKARQQFHDLMERVAPSDKAAYAMALERCPHLIRLESNPDYYLESSRYDAYAACRRVLEYWSLRLEWFGEDRAFLPMNISGTGALSPEDIEVLNTGFMMLLPEDNQGRAVAFHDRARLTHPDVMDVSKRKRCIFYVLSVAGESASCRQNGLVFLSAFCDKTRKSTFDLQMLSDKVALMKKEVLPYHFVGLHIVMLSQRPILNMVVPMTVQAFEKMDCLKRGIVVHGRKPTEQLLEDLKRHGFDPESIPKVPFGGFWTLGCFRRWLDDRKLKERRIYDNVSAVAIGDEHHHHNPDSQESGGSDHDGDEDNEQLRKKRKMGAAYARRKRARNKIEMEVMHAEVERLRKQQRDLESSHQELQKLLADAEAIAQRVEEDPEYRARVTGLPASATAPTEEPEPEGPAGATAAEPLEVPSASFPSNSSNPDLGAGLGHNYGRGANLPQDAVSAEQQGDMRLLRQLMASMVQHPDASAVAPPAAPSTTAGLFQHLHAPLSLGLSHHLQQHVTPPSFSAAANHQLLLSLLAGVTGNGNNNGSGSSIQQPSYQPSPTEFLLASAAGVAPSQPPAARPLAASSLASASVAPGAGYHPSQENILRTLCSVFGSGGPSSTAADDNNNQAHLRALAGAQHAASLHHLHHGRHTS